MSIQVGMGVSKNVADSRKAGFDACKMAMEKLGGEKPDFTFTFASVVFNQEELVKGISEASVGTSGIGCSVAGEITSDGPMTDAVAVMAIKSDVISFTTGLGKDIKSGARKAGNQLAEDIKRKATEPLRAMIILPDTLTNTTCGSGADTVNGVLDVLGSTFPVVGGGAGDDSLLKNTLKKTYQYCDGKVTDNAVSGVGLSGKFSFAFNVRHGWTPVSMPMKVTKSDGAIIHEIDDRPAIEMYVDYFNEKQEEFKKETFSATAIMYPLGLKVPDMDEYFLRTPLMVDKNGSIVCAAEVPVGSVVRLMKGGKESALEAAKSAARKIVSDLQKENAKPKFALIFSCIARKVLFGMESNDEIAAIAQVLGKDVPLLGMASYGEISTFSEEIPFFHQMKGETKEHLFQSKFFNETAVIFVVGE